MSPLSFAAVSPFLTLAVLLVLVPVFPSASAASAASAVPRTLNLTGSSNLVAYWGQDCVDNEPSLATVCADPAYDVLILSFVDRFGNFSLPHLDLADHCSGHVGNSTMTHCPQVGKDIAACQAMGKTVLMSLGGADGKHSLASREDAVDLAHQMWNLMMGGKSDLRPFDSAVLDGVDLDIENNLPAYYADFMTTLRGLFASDPARQYLISAAPQCVYPDASLGPDHERRNVTVPTAISHAAFDFLNMQFYNNDCGVKYYGTKAFNFPLWADQIPAINPNPHIKLMLGLPAAEDAGGGYVNASVVQAIVAELKKLPAFGGAMIWDDGYALKNNNFQTQLKKILTVQYGEEEERGVHGSRQGQQRRELSE